MKAQGSSTKARLALAASACMLLALGCENPLLKKAEQVVAAKESPTIVVRGADGAIADGATIDLGKVSKNGTVDTELTIANNGKSALSISTCDVRVAVGESGAFSVSQVPVSKVEAGGSTTLIVHFDASTVGGKSAILSIVSNDVATPSYAVKFAASVTTAPTGLVAASSHNLIGLSWNAVATADSYTVYWAGSAGVTKANGTAIAGIAATSCEVSGLTDGTMYYFIVSATIGGVEYDASPQVAAAPRNAPSPPKALTPTNVDPTVKGHSNVHLTWSAPSNGTVDHYIVYHLKDGTSLTTSNSDRMSASLPSGTLAYDDASATPGLVNYYLVTAVDSSAQPSDPASASILTQPDPPSGFNAAAGTNSVALTWAAPANGAESYSIYRSTSSGFTPTDDGDGKNLVGTATTTAYTDSTATGGSTYYYNIKAVNAAGGASLAFGEISCTPLKSNDATLSGIGVTIGGASVAGEAVVSGSGVLSPAFNADTLFYTVSLPWNAGTSLTVTGVAHEAHAAVVNPGTITLTNGGIASSISVTVTSQDKSATKTYTITAVYQKTFAFVVNNADNTVWSYIQDPATELLTKVDSYTTGSSPVTVAVSPNNKYLYTANKGANSISAFSINPNATLTPIATYSTGAYYPWDLKISPNGKFLFTYNSDGTNGYVSSWLVNANGTLSSATVNLASQTRDASCPCQMAVSPDSAHVYTMPYYESPYITRFDVNQTTGLLTTGDTSTNFLTNVSNSMLSFAIHPTGKALYITLGTTGWSYVYTSLITAGTGVVNSAAASVYNDGVWPARAIVDPLGKCLFYFRTNYLHYSRIDQASYLPEASYTYTGLAGDDNNYNRACFDPTDSYLFMVHGSGNYLSVHPVTYSGLTPAFTTKGTTIPTGNAPWQMAVARQPGY